MNRYEVIVISTLPECQGRMVLATDPNQTIDFVIKEFCASKNIAHRSNFSLCNQGHQVLPRRSKLSKCSIQSGEELYLSVNGKLILIKVFASATL